MIPDKIPAWLAELPGDANLSSRDMANIFGYKGNANISNAEIKGKIPPRSGKFRNNLNGHYYCTWKVSTVRNFIRRHNREHRNNSKQATES